MLADFILTSEMLEEYIQQDDSTEEDLIVNEKEEVGTNESDNSEVTLKETEELEKKSTLFR